jgi:hypothetical protein
LPAAAGAGCDLKIEMQATRLPLQQTIRWLSAWRSAFRDLKQKRPAGIFQRGALN